MHQALAGQRLGIGFSFVDIVSLDAAPLEQADRWLARYRVFWQETLDALADFVAEGDA